MRQEIKIFRHEMFGDIRTMTNKSGETFFIGKDVAKALGYKNPQKALRDHVDEEDKTLNVSFTVNGTTPVIINESGLYQSWGSVLLIIFYVENLDVGSWGVKNDV